jgi:hypothetical protein
MLGGETGSSSLEERKSESFSKSSSVTTSDASGSLDGESTFPCWLLCFFSKEDESVISNESSLSEACTYSGFSSLWQFLRLMDFPFDFDESCLDFSSFECCFLSSDESMFDLKEIFDEDRGLGFAE